MMTYKIFVRKEIFSDFLVIMIKKNKTTRIEIDVMREIIKELLISTKSKMLIIIPQK